MNLTELYEQLAVGELKNLAMSAGGTIREDDRATILLRANEGLTRLHTRFLLREDDLLLEQQGNRTDYPLLAKHAFSAQGEGTGPYFINDMGRPFTMDAIKILSVTDEFGRQLPLNSEMSAYSVFTPRPNILQIPNPVQGSPTGVHYQADHPRLLAEEEDDQIIDLPEFLVPALRSFISWKVCSAINTQEMTVKSGEHAKSFDTICIEAEESGLITTGSFTGGHRFEKNGWV